jgi:toxin HigB-1
MIKTFRSKGLADLWSKGTTGKINAKLLDRIMERLDALDAATLVGDLNVPGFDFHPLRGFKPTRYTLHVNGPWCVTFEFHQGDAYKVDLEQYH